MCKQYEYIKLTFCVHLTMIYSVIQFQKTCNHYLIQHKYYSQAFLGNVKLNNALIALVTIRYNLLMAFITCVYGIADHSIKIPFTTLSEKYIWETFTFMLLLHLLHLDFELICFSLIPCKHCCKCSLTSELTMAQWQSIFEQMFIQTI